MPFPDGFAEMPIVRNRSLDACNHTLAGDNRGTSDKLRDCSISMDRDLRVAVWLEGTNDERRRMK